MAGSIITTQKLIKKVSPLNLTGEMNRLEHFSDKLTQGNMFPDL